MCSASVSAHRRPIVIWWGKEALTQFYNAYISFLGSTKHPGDNRRAVAGVKSGTSFDPMLETVFASGEATWSEEFLYVIVRNLPRGRLFHLFVQPDPRRHRCPRRHLLRVQ
jgi:hypothetical protein